MKISKWQIQKSISLIDKVFEKEIKKTLNLQKILGPLLINPQTGLNDDLSGTEKPISFKYQNRWIEIVQSTAKWKRQALYNYNSKPYSGIYVEMNAIRQDEAKLTKYHSLHVDQYDWEMVIQKEDRHLDFLKLTVKKLWRVLQKIKIAVGKITPLQDKIDQKVTFISSQELLNLFPDKRPEERERIFAQEKKVIFVYKIGDYLSNNEKHAERAPDYDDWQLNGDLIVWDKQNNDAMELSSMGIRVDKTNLLKQLQKKNALHKKNNTFHQQIITNKLPLTIGGGIGKSRINMFILEQDHIKNVQPSFEAFL